MVLRALQHNSGEFRREEMHMIGMGAGGLPYFPMYLVFRQYFCLKLLD